MIKIGIVARKSFDDEGKLCFLIRESNLRNVILKAGAIPVLLVPQQITMYENLQKPPFILTKEEKQRTQELLEICDGFILPGGDEWTYLDEAVIDYAKISKKPILGICLGMQVMAIEKDFKNIKKLPDNNHKSKEKYVHSIQIKQDSLLYKITNQKELQVNSRHVHTVNVASSYEVVAISNDGIIEAIEYKNHPFFLGIQWHPEDMKDYDMTSQLIFNALITACKTLKKDYNNNCS